MTECPILGFIVEENIWLRVGGAGTCIVESVPVKFKEEWLDVYLELL